MSISEIRQFLTASNAISFIAIDRNESYDWIAKILRSVAYRKLTKPDKGLVINYIETMTGYSEPQAKRLIRAWVKRGQIVRKTYHRHSFPCVYTRQDIVLLANVDTAHNTLSGPVTAAILKREYIKFGDVKFKQLSKLSISHLYNLRTTTTYRNHAIVFHHTKGSSVSIGERHKPQPEGRPGFIRIDTVHQGDSSAGEKGVYHVNFVDEVTQYEFVACVVSGSP